MSVNNLLSDSFDLPGGLDGAALQEQPLNPELNPEGLETSLRINEHLLFLVVVSYSQVCEHALKNDAGDEGAGAVLLSLLKDKVLDEALSLLPEHVPPLHVLR